MLKPRQLRHSKEKVNHLLGYYKKNAENMLKSGYDT